MNSRLVLRSILASVFVLGGCSAIIGVNDITYDPGATQGTDVDGSTTNPDGGPTKLEDGATVLPDGAVVEDGSIDEDSAACPGANLATDPKHCGRCGHDCLGGECSAGKCQAVQLGTAQSAPLTFVAVSDNDVFATGYVDVTSQVGGVWRAPKIPGAGVTSFVDDATMRYAAGITAIDQKLYVLDYDYKTSGGGLYSCDLSAAKCTPSKLADAESPLGLASVGGKIYYANDGTGIMVYTPGGSAATFRADFPGPRLYADGKNAYYIILFNGGAGRYAALLEALPSGTVAEMTRFETPTAFTGDIAGNATDLFFTAWDLEGNGGGVARRISRTQGQPSCDYGGSTNVRPQGITVDAENVYWTNGGTGPEDGSWTNGSLNTCKLSGCCATPEVLWTGSGRPFGVTTDDKAIYWVTRQTGQIWKIAKP